MTDDRKILDELAAKRAELDRQIKEITHRGDGTPWGSILSDIIYSIIEEHPELYGGRRQGKIETYKIYTRIHLEVSSRIGFKTKTMTKSEYELAVSYLNEKYSSV